MPPHGDAASEVPDHGEVSSGVEGCVVDEHGAESWKNAGPGRWAGVARVNGAGPAVTATVRVEAKPPAAPEEGQDNQAANAHDLR